MDIHNILKKANKVLSPKPGKEHQKMSSNERELLSYQERERQDNIRKDLDQYRKKNSDELWRGTPMSSKAPILTTPQFGQKKKKKKFKQTNILGGKSNIL